MSQTQLKVVHVGAGSHVFGPSMLVQALLEHRLDSLELVLVDPANEARELMVGVGRRMAETSGLTNVTVRGEAAWADALDGADFVICSAAPGMHAGYEHVREAVAQHAPDHVISEFGGIHGADCTLRNVKLVASLAKDMARLCPKATLLNATNPLPRICRAAALQGIETVGFCTVSSAVYDWLHQLFGGEPIRWPFKAARDRWQVTAGGVNHLSWITKLINRADGSDALPAVMEKLDAGASVPGWKHAEALSREVRLPLAVADDHTRDFMPPRPGDAGLDHISHGSAERREALAKALSDFAAGRCAWEDVPSTVAWERPFDLVAARTGRSESATFHALNLPNAGQLPDLPADIYVESPVTADSAGMRPETITLTPAATELCRRTAEVSELLVKAALTGSRKDLLAAFELDPTVTDVSAGERALDAAIARHRDLVNL